FYLCTSSRSQVKHVLILHDVDQYNYHRANDCNQAASQNELSNGRFELSQSNVLDFFASNPNMYQLPKGTVMDDWEEILLGPETCRLKKRAGGGHRR
ncbi:MAG: hypothetical protein KDD25_08480, partial [Bdellovibrionales bacterium]|nr:hypothetical protein [Bdellovibrionales bacterium]